MTSFGYNILGFGAGGGVGPYTVDYVVVAAGGGGGGTASFAFASGGSGGGAGGYRVSWNSSSYDEPSTTPIEVDPGGSYAITVGSGGGMNTQGGQSVFSTITSTGGGGGGGFGNGQPGKPGGSGVVLLRYETGDAPGATSGGSKTTDGTATIHTFNSTGTFLS